MDDFNEHNLFNTFLQQDYRFYKLGEKFTFITEDFVCLISKLDAYVLVHILKSLFPNKYLA